MTNWRDRTYNPTEEYLHDLLFGRKVVKVNQNGDEGTLTLDDGTVLMLGGNEGCGGCPSGYYGLTALNTVDNAISNVKLTEDFDDKDEYRESDGTYRIFVIAEDQNEHLLAQFDGSDGNGYYGTGYWITILKDFT